VDGQHSARQAGVPTLDGGTISILIQDEIRSTFGWKLEDDSRSAHALKAYCQQKSLDLWNNEMRGAELMKLGVNMKADLALSRTITILGAAAEVEDVVTAIEGDHGIIAADGAIGVLTELDDWYQEKAWRRVRFIVSDGDGDFQHLLEAARRDIPFILHAHGDNENAWHELLELIYEHGPPLILTHQTPEQIPGMYNPGGFTDGDRAVCIALALGARAENLNLSGFRTDIIGKWTGRTVPSRKMKKLQWMEKILKQLGVHW
jgi:uncharacterized Rossmann fold enzyme